MATPSLLDILRHTPIWVWGVLALLVGLGLRSLRPRRVRRGQVVLAPLLLLPLGLVTGLRTPATLPAWALGLVVGVGLAWAWLPPPRDVRYDAARDELTLPGSLVPLGLMLGLFGLNYALAVALATGRLQPESGWAQVLAGGCGLCSGAFLGRALRLRRVGA